MDRVVALVPIAAELDTDLIRLFANITPESEWGDLFADDLIEGMGQLGFRLVSLSKGLSKIRWAIGYLLLMAEQRWVEFCTAIGELKEFDGWVHERIGKEYSYQTYRNWMRAAEIYLVPNSVGRIWLENNGVTRAELVDKCSMDKAMRVVGTLAARKGDVNGDIAQALVVEEVHSYEITAMLRGDDDLPVVDNVDSTVYYDKKSGQVFVDMDGERDVVFTVGAPAGKIGRQTLRSVLEFLGPMYWVGGD